MYDNLWLQYPQGYNRLRGYGFPLLWMYYCNHAQKTRYTMQWIKDRIFHESYLHTNGIDAILRWHRIQKGARLLNQ